MNRNIVLSAAAWLLAANIASAQVAQVVQVAEVPPSTGAVFLSKQELIRAVTSPRTPGTALASLGSVRAGDDRINVDVLKRLDASAEGPVSHNVVTEVYYILEGGGTMETGGTITDPTPMLTNGKPVNPASIGPSMRGTKMSGGTTHHVTAGDVVMIPPGVPHRFQSLDGFVTYMVVRMNPGYEKGKP